MKVVNVTEVVMLLEELDRINSLPLDDIVFVGISGEEIVVDKDALSEWKFIGLNNTSFIRDYFMGGLDK